ncbi:MAG: hypothetical protein VYC17_06725 [Nitrospinota bacterium]|nr:hypothetical protein [Nitrospinota bacterium]
MATAVTVPYQKIVSSSISLLIIDPVSNTNTPYRAWFHPKINREVSNAEIAIFAVGDGEFFACTIEQPGSTTKLAL